MLRTYGHNQAVNCTNGIRLTVLNSSHAENLADLLRNCTGAANFWVDWSGDVEISSTLAVGGGGTLSVKGAGAAATIYGKGGVQLFSVVDSTLKLYDLSLVGGGVLPSEGNGGGAAVSANRGSIIFVHNCSFVGNNASDNHHGEFTTSQIGQRSRIIENDPSLILFYTYTDGGSACNANSQQRATCKPPVKHNTQLG